MKVVKKSKPFNAKKAKKQLDILWSLSIRHRDQTCRRCGGNGGIQAAHIFSRGNLTTRWDTENGLGLCYACHIHWAHRKPVEFTLWVIELLGRQKFSELKKKSQKIYDSSNLKKDFLIIKEKLEKELEAAGKE